MWEMYMDMVPDKAITYILQYWRQHLESVPQDIRHQIAYIDPDTSEAVFAKTIKQCIIIGII